MSQPENIEDAIEQNALGPKRVQVGNQSIEQQSIDDQIKAHNFAARQTAKSKAGLGIRFQQIIPPGCG